MIGFERMFKVVSRRWNNKYLELGKKEKNKNGSNAGKDSRLSLSLSLSLCLSLSVFLFLSFPPFPSYLWTATVLAVPLKSQTKSLMIRANHFQIVSMSKEIPKVRMITFKPNNIALCLSSSLLRTLSPPLPACLRTLRTSRQQWNETLQ